MKLRSTTLAIITGCVAFGHLQCFAQSLTVDTNTTIKTFNGSPLGININNLTDSAARQLPNARPLHEAINALGVNWLRFPEGEQGDVYLWSSETNPATADNPSWLLQGPNDWPFNDPDFTNPDGTPKDIMSYDEFRNLANATNTTQNMLMIVPYDSAYKVGTPNPPTVEQLQEYAANWVRYTKNQGITGIRWEIGNETDLNPPAYAGNDPGAVQQAADIIAFSQAIKAEDSTAKVGVGPVSTARLSALLATPGLPEAIDFISLHNYPVYNWENGITDYTTNQNLIYPVENMLQVINSANISQEIKDRLEVHVTETGVMDWANSWKNTNDLGRALVNFEMLGQLIENPQIHSTEQWVTRWIHDENASSNNLIANGSFQDGLTGWIGNATIVGDGKVGTDAASLSNNSAIVHPINVAPGENVELQGWLASNGSQWSGMGVTFKKDNVTVAESSVQATSSDWRQYQLNALAPDDFDYAEVWLFATDNLQADGIRVVEGKFLSSYASLTPLNELTPTGQSIALWNQYFLPSLIGTNLLDVPNVTARTLFDPETNQINLFLLNMNGATVNIPINILSDINYDRATVLRLTGIDFQDLNPDFSFFQNINVLNNAFSTELAPYSLTIITIPEPSSAGLVLAALIAAKCYQRVRLKTK